MWPLPLSGSARSSSLRPRRALQVHAETYGKTGCRRIVPGQFVATDPRGRALLWGAEGR